MEYINNLPLLTSYNITKNKKKKYTTELNNT